VTAPWGTRRFLVRDPGGQPMRSRLGACVGWAEHSEAQHGSRLNLPVGLRRWSRLNPTYGLSQPWPEPFPGVTSLCAGRALTPTLSRRERGLFEQAFSSIGAVVWKTAQPFPGVTSECGARPHPAPLPRERGLTEQVFSRRETLDRAVAWKTAQPFPGVTSVCGACPHPNPFPEGEGVIRAGVQLYRSRSLENGAAFSGSDFSVRGAPSPQPSHRGRGEPSRCSAAVKRSTACRPALNPR